MVDIEVTQVTRISFQRFINHLRAASVLNFPRVGKRAGRFCYGNTTVHIGMEIWIEFLKTEAIVLLVHLFWKYQSKQPIPSTHIYLIG